MSIEQNYLNIRTIRIKFYNKRIKFRYNLNFFYILSMKILAIYKATGVLYLQKYFHDILVSYTTITEQKYRSKIVYMIWLYDSIHITLPTHVRYY